MSPATTGATRGSMAKFDKQFQLDVLGASISDPLYRRNAGRILRPEHFDSNEMQWLWRKLTEMPPQDIPSARLLAQWLKREFSDKDKRKDHKSVAVEAFKSKTTHAASSLEELNAFVQFRVAAKQMEGALKDLDHGDVDSAIEKLAHAAKYRPDSHYECDDWFEGFARRQLLRKERAEDPNSSYRVSSGLGHLDKLLGGGLKPGDFMIAAALTGVGKSHWAIQSACRSAMMGQRTLLVDTENGLDIEFARIDAKLMGIASQRMDQYELTAMELSQIRGKLARMAKRMSKTLRVVNIPLRRAKMSTFEQAIEDWEQQLGEPIKYAIVDCGDHLRPSERDKEKRLDQKNTFEELKSIADERKIPIQATAQLSKEAMGRIATGEQLSESYDKARIASIVWTLNQRKRQAASGLMDGYLAKHRGGTSRIWVPMKVDLSRSHFEYDEERDEKDDDEEDSE